MTSLLGYKKGHFSLNTIINVKSNIWENFIRVTPHNLFTPKLSIWADYNVNSYIYILDPLYFLENKILQSHKVRVDFGPLGNGYHKLWIKDE